MVEVFPGLFVGNEEDYHDMIHHQNGWSVVHACKEPYHRRALGYSGRAAPKTHPEYLVARREERLILNLVDAPNPAYIPKEVIDAALEFIETRLRDGRRVLVHCNEGYSRAPSIAFLYLVSRTDQFAGHDVDTALTAFQSLYPSYNPASGVHGFVRAHYRAYCQDKAK